MVDMRQRIFASISANGYDFAHTLLGLAVNVIIRMGLEMKKNSIVSYPEILGRTIQQRRKQLGLEQDVLSARSGIPQSTISRIERGEALINSEQISYLADALGLSPSDFWLRADTIKRSFEARGATILRERVSADMIRSSPLLVTGTALTALMMSLTGDHGN